MNRLILATLSAICVVALAIVSLQSLDSSSDTTQPVVLYCAASNRAVIEACCRQYHSTTGRVVQVQYGASQTLLSSIQISGAGDLFLPADDSYLAIARERNLISEQWPLAEMRATVAVHQGNPLSIQSFNDLLRDDVRLVQANPDAAAIGKVVRDSLIQTDRWKDLERATTAFRTSVTDVANDLVIGTADVGIVYDVVLHSYPDLQAINLPEFNNIVSHVSIGVLSQSKHFDAATQFVQFLIDDDGGLKLYAENGFEVAKAP